MRNFYSLIGLLVLLAITSCESDRHRIRKSYFEDGTLKSEVEMVGDERHGVGKYYFPSGKLQYLIHYDNGLQHGEYRTYYENGKLEMISEYRDDKLHGWQRSYYESGRKRLVTEFVGGQPGDYSIHLAESGDTLAFYNAGRAIRFFENGKVEQIICSQNYELSSIRSIRFSPDGKVVKREEPLYCFTSRDSLLLDEQYPNWKTSAVVSKASE